MTIINDYLDQSGRTITTSIYFMIHSVLIHKYPDMTTPYYQNSHNKKQNNSFVGINIPSDNSLYRVSFVCEAFVQHPGRARE